MTKWIKCSDRLPDLNEGKLWLTVEWTGRGNTYRSVIVIDAYDLKLRASATSDLEGKKPIAWKPYKMPAPYRGKA